MSYRQALTTSEWHWCVNCSAWPLTDFSEREDLPPAGGEQSVCPECISLNAAATAAQRPANI